MANDYNVQKELLTTRPEVVPKMTVSFARKVCTTCSFIIEFLSRHSFFLFSFLYINKVFTVQAKMVHQAQNQIKFYAGTSINIVPRDQENPSQWKLDTIPLVEKNTIKQIHMNTDPNKKFVPGDPTASKDVNIIVLLVPMVMKLDCLIISVQVFVQPDSIAWRVLLNLRNVHGIHILQLGMTFVLNVIMYPMMVVDDVKQVESVVRNSI